jgi:hypothetical protein
MSERGPSFSPDKPERTPRERMIAAMGIIAFNFELGPNAHTPEVITITPETAPETGVEPTRPLTDDEASYVAGTLGSAVVKTTIEPTVQ